AMHALARERLGPLATRVHFVNGDFRQPDWHARLPTAQAVLAHQAIHELRHKRHAVALYRAVRELLPAKGPFLMCDHFNGDGGMTNDALYMTPDEHADALATGGFSRVDELHREGSLILFRAE